MSELMKYVPSVLSVLSICTAIFFSYSNIQVQLATLNASLANIQHRLASNEQTVEKVNDRLTRYIEREKEKCNGR